MTLRGCTYSSIACEEKGEERGSNELEEENQDRVEDGGLQIATFHFGLFNLYFI